MNAEAAPSAERLADAIEARASADLYAAAPPSMRAHAQQERGVTLLCIPTLPVTFFNRVIGLGNEHAAVAGDLDRIVAFFAEAGVADYWIHLSPHARPPALPALLSARGYAPPARRSWMKFLRGTASQPALPATALTLRAARAEDASAVAQVVVTAYGMPPAVAPWFAALIGRPGWQVWVAERDGAIVATGSLYVDGRHGWLGIGATLPAHRGLGAQSHLLAARIGAAREAGCEVVATETGEPVGGERNPSFDNIRRAGFEAAYSRLNCAAPAPARPADRRGA